MSLQYNKQRSGRTEAEANDTELGDQRDSEVTLSAGWRGIAEALDCSVSIEHDSETERRPTADEIVDQHTTAREGLLLAAGLDPVERADPEVLTV